MITVAMKRKRAGLYLPIAGSPDRQESAAVRGTPCLGRGLHLRTEGRSCW